MPGKQRGKTESGRFRVGAKEEGFTVVVVVKSSCSVLAFGPVFLSLPINKLVWFRNSAQWDARVTVYFRGNGR